MSKQSKRYRTWIRFLRAFVPQIPTVFSAFGILIPPWMTPFLILLGAGLTAADKALRMGVSEYKAKRGKTIARQNMVKTLRARREKMNGRR